MSGASSSPDSSGAGDADLLGAGISHDLRAPLRIVEGFARILREDYAAVLDRQGIDHLDRILTAAQRMNGMIDVLMGLAELGARSMRRLPVDLSALAREILGELQQTQPQRAVRTQVQDGLVRYGDPELLRRVMENLLGNAWKYTARQPAAHIAFAAEPGPDGRTRFFVKDNGAGFDMRLAPQLFTPFQRLHSAAEFPGDGVGLATVRRIVLRHGGEVGALGEPGQGASFWFSLAERAERTEQARAESTGR